MKITPISALTLLVCCLVFFTSGCTVAPSAAPVQSEAAAVEVVSPRCGDPSRLADTISFYNWAEYIDPEILAMFEEECGVEVIYDTYTSNDELLAKLQAGASGYDLIVPSDYMVSIMLELDLLRPLDYDNIPNMANIDVLFLDPPYDPDNVHTVPYQWGTVGIGYDAAAIDGEISGWESLFEPEMAAQYSGRLSLLNEMRDVIGSALKYLGYSANSTNPDELEEAKQVLLAIKPHVAAFDSISYADLLVSGETMIGQGWNGLFFIAMYENPDSDLRYVIPTEGSIIWTDNMAIPRTAANPYTAEVLINYLLEPEIGAMITNFAYYASPNTASEPHILDEIKNDPGIYPSAETRAQLEFVRDVGEMTPVYERIWTEIKAE